VERYLLVPHEVQLGAVLHQAKLRVHKSHERVLAEQLQQQWQQAQSVGKWWRGNDAVRYHCERLALPQLDAVLKVLHACEQLRALRRFHAAAMTIIFITFRIGLCPNHEATSNSNENYGTCN